MAIILKQSERSEAYLELLGELKNTFVKAGNLVIRLYKQGKKEGLDSELIRSDIVSALNRALSERQIRNLMPLELKYSKFANKSKAVVELVIEPEPEIETEAEKSAASSGEIHTVEDLSTPSVKLLDGCQLILGDCTDPNISSKIADNSIDLIFTDPPYTAGSLPLYANLAKLAMRVLKPGGNLIAYIGQYALFEIGQMLQASGLKYNWICYVKHTGNNDVMWSRNVIVRGKPLLWFYKDHLRTAIDVNGDHKEMYVADFIESKDPDKSLHEWTQSPVEARYFIEKLTHPKGSVVFDPFMGSGTTGKAALQLNRQFIGIETDPVTFVEARKNISLQAS